jgi:hypothetical protein
MPRDGTRLALFIDGANLYATAKTLGFHIDYKEFQSRGNLVRAFYYTVIVEDQEFSSVRPLLDWSSAPVTLSPVSSRARSLVICPNWAAAQCRWPLRFSD